MIVPANVSAGVSRITTRETSTRGMTAVSPGAGTPLDQFPAAFQSAAPCCDGLPVHVVVSAFVQDAATAMPVIRTI